MIFKKNCFYFFSSFLQFLMSFFSSILLVTHTHNFFRKKFRIHLALEQTKDQVLNVIKRETTKSGGEVQSIEEGEEEVRRLLKVESK